MVKDWKTLKKINDLSEINSTVKKQKKKLTQGRTFNFKHAAE